MGRRHSSPCFYCLTRWAAGAASWRSSSWHLRVSATLPLPLAGAFEGRPAASLSAPSRPCSTPLRHLLAHHTHTHTSAACSCQGGVWWRGLELGGSGPQQGQDCADQPRESCLRPPVRFHSLTGGAPLRAEGGVGGEEASGEAGCGWAVHDSLLRWGVQRPGGAAGLACGALASNACCSPTRLLPRAPRAGLPPLPPPPAAVCCRPLLPALPPAWRLTRNHPPSPRPPPTPLADRSTTSRWLGRRRSLRAGLRRSPTTTRWRPRLPSKKHGLGCLFTCCEGKV